MDLQLSTLQQIIHYIKENHPIDDMEIQKIESAIQLLKDCFLDGDIIDNSNSCDDDLVYYVSHSMAVAQYIASWRFDYTVVIAALLHELPVNNIKSLDDLEPLIDELTYAVLKGYIDIHMELSSFELSHSVDDEGIINNYLNSPYPESFYIEIAEHVDILSRNLNNYSEKALSFAQKTREILIPQVKHINAYRMVDMLEELCFKIENKKVYQAISSTIQKVDDLNEFYRQQFITVLNRIFDKNSNIIPPKLKQIQSCIKLFYANKRSVVSIYRFITQNDAILQQDKTLQYDLEKLNNFYRTAYYDLVLVLDEEVLSEDNCTTIDVFMEYFETMLQPEGAFLYGCYYTTNKDSYYFLLSDSMRNMYRFFVQSESDYLHYLYGDIISRDKFNLNYLSKKNESQIKVFRKDGTAEMVDKGITVLDFAFKIHEDLGLHFANAILNKNDRLLPAHTILSNGDTIEIIKSDNITAELNWFRYLKTDLAINFLIKYFKTLYKRTEYNIKVFTKDGSAVWIQDGATVLDFAFMIHKDLGLHFDYALINGGKRHFSVDYVLSDGDTVIIQQAMTINVDYYWFRHVKTAKAINQLIDYFKML